MGRQRNKFQRKEQEETSIKDLNKRERHHQSHKKFKVKVLKVKMDEHSEILNQKKKNQSELKNIVTEIKIQ